MKVSGQKVAQHRAALVATAKRLLKERGFDGAGVVDISREAGLTQGALYGQFKSKDALLLAACREAFAEGTATWGRLCATMPDALSAYLDTYLSDAHVEDVGNSCPMTACVSEVSRQDPAIAATFADGFRTLVDAVERALPGAEAGSASQERALALVAAMVGSVALARAVKPTNPRLSQDIITAARKQLRIFAACG